MKKRPRRVISRSSFLASITDEALFLLEHPYRRNEKSKDESGHCQEDEDDGQTPQGHYPLGDATYTYPRCEHG